MGVFTRPAVERIARTAFELARRRRKQADDRAQGQRAAAEHRACSSDVCREVGERYPDVVVDDFHIDAMTVHLLRRAADFDVLVAENMFGDILSDMAGELAGSLGIAPSINASDDRCMAQASHGSAPDIAGQGPGQPDRDDPVARRCCSTGWARGTATSALADAAVRVEAGVRAAVRRRDEHPRPRRHGLHRASSPPPSWSGSPRRALTASSGTCGAVDRQPAGGGPGHGERRGGRPQHAGGADAGGDQPDRAGDEHLAEPVAGEPQRHRPPAQPGGATSASHDMVSGCPTPRPSPSRTTSDGQCRPSAAGTADDGHGDGRERRR